MEAGRPLKFKSPEILEQKVEEWLKGREDKGMPLTITSLAIALDTTRETLLDYGRKEAYSDTIARAKMLCHSYAEDQLYLARSANGAQFNLINNWGWRDKREQAITGADGGPVSVETSERPKLSKDEWLKLHGLAND